MREESDGRFYFDYNQAARYVIHSHRTEEKELMIIEIGGMQVTKGGEEMYLVISERKEVRDYLGEWTKMQLTLYLEMTSATLIEEGNAVEYPLTISDVKWFYSARKKARNKKLFRANKILIGELQTDTKGNPKKDKNGKPIYDGGIEEYRDLLKQKENLEKLLAERYGRKQIANNQESMYRNKCARMIELIRENGIPLSVFRPDPICPGCRNSGIDGKGLVCSCAQAREEEIKAFCAAERLKKKLAETWADRFGDEEDEDDEFED